VNRDSTVAINVSLLALDNEEESGRVIHRLTHAPSLEARLHLTQSHPRRIWRPLQRKATIMGITPRKAEEVISLKVTLRGMRPPIWRRLEVPSRLSLAGLHDVIQAAMDWEGRHLYVFDVAGRRYGNPAAVDDVTDDKLLTVGGVLKSGIRRFTYTYDFGDDWQHDIVIEGKKAAVGGRR
jgi:hypothetical protein